MGPLVRRHSECQMMSVACCNKVPCRRNRLAVCGNDHRRRPCPQPADARGMGCDLSARPAVNSNKAIGAADTKMLLAQARLMLDEALQKKPVR